MTATSAPSAARQRITQRLALAVFGLALLLRAVHTVQICHSPFEQGRIHLVDARYYDAAARRVATGAGLSDDVYFMAPLYPYALGGLYRLISLANGGTLPTADAPGVEIDIARYVQALLGACSCLLLFSLGRRLCGTLCGVVAGFGGALNPIFIYQDALLLASGLNTLVNLLALRACLAARDRDQPGAWWLAGAAVAVCVFAHGTALLLLPLIALWLAADPALGGWRGRLWRVACLTAPTVLLLIVVTARNRVVGGDWVPLTSNAGLNFYIGNARGADGTFRRVPPEWRNLPGATLGWHHAGLARGADDPLPSAISRRLMSEALHDMRQDPAGALRLFIRKLRLFWHATELGSSDQYYFHRRYSTILGLPLPGFGVLAPLGVVGIALSWRQRRFALPRGMLGAQVVAFVLMFVLGRYRLVATACLLLFAGHAVAQLVLALRRRRIGRSVAICAAIATLAWLCHLPIDGVSRERGFGEQYRQLAEIERARGQIDAAIAANEAALHYDFAPFDERPQRIATLTALLRMYRQRAAWSDVRRIATTTLELIGDDPAYARLQGVLRDDLAPADDQR